LREIICETLNTEEIDLVILNNAPPYFAKNIINYGKLLFCNNKNQLTDFIEVTTMLYLDFMYYRNQFLKTFKHISGIE